jgi:hypothetical protein
MATKRKRADSSDDVFSPDPQYAVLTAVYFEDDDGYTGFVEELWSVSVHERNIRDARTRLTEAAQKFLRENRRDILQRAEPHDRVTRERMVVEIE